MKPLLIVLLFAVPLHASITSVQLLASAAGCSGSTGTTCSITVSATTAGNSALVCFGANSGSLTTPTGGGTWIADPVLNTATLSCWFNYSLTGGVTTISTTVSSNVGRVAMFGEWHSSFSSPSWVYDTSASGSCGGSNCAGVALSTLGSNDCIIQILLNATQTGMSTAGWTTPVCQAGNTRCISQKANLNSGAAPTWTNSTTGQIYGVAIRETNLRGTRVTQQ